MLDPASFAEKWNNCAPPVTIQTIIPPFTPTPFVKSYHAREQNPREQKSSAEALFVSGESFIRNTAGVSQPMESQESLDVGFRLEL